MEKSNRLAFTKTRLLGLPVPEKGREYSYDTKTPGLACCVTSKGQRTLYIYKRISGRPVRYRLGRFPSELSVEAARKMTSRVLAEIADGNDPQADRQTVRREPTVRDAFADWLEYAKAHKRTWQEDERQYNTFLKPWGGRKAASISKTNVVALHAKIGHDNGQYAANRVLALLQSMLNRVIQDDSVMWTGPSPTVGVKRFKERSRDRFLTPDELPQFFQALADEPNSIFRDFFLLALLTGARRGNVLAMRWDQLTLEGLWRIPANQAKNDDVQLVHLAPAAMKILDARRELCDGSPFVFPGSGKSGHLASVRDAWVCIRKRAGLDDLRIHDLRRTLGSWQAIGGSSLQIIGASLGHRDPKATAIYARLGADPVRDSVTSAAAAMLEFMPEKGGDDDDES